jgi:FAD/FMN-containing dehydrogenase
MSRRARRWLLTSGVIIVLIAGCLGKPIYHLTRTWLADRDEVTPPPAGFVDDASRLNETAVAEVWDIPAEPAAAEAQLRDLLGQARALHLTVSIAGARHTMGGHTITPGGIVVNMLPFKHMRLDDKSAILHVGAGARWVDILPYLDQRGYSVAIMQSNNTFSVGGSLSANCHGWQPDRPPICSSVEAFRLMKADGTVVHCSRNENDELFRLALGGYGLFGIILDVELRVVPNELYRVETKLLSSTDYAASFEQKVTRTGDVGMAYGRLCIVPGDTFLREAILTAFHRVPGSVKDILPLAQLPASALRRAVFRGSVDSDYGKRLRWDAETRLAPELSSKRFSRNQLLNESAEVYREHSATRTDILHEYFIPVAQVEKFLERLRVLIPRQKGDLLNVTVRNVLRDDDTMLRYADQDMFAFVMLFNQLRTAEADARMEAMTQDLIEAALAVGGRYYLPYRLHATPAQFRRAYPQADAFFAKKRQLDPDGIFQNQFYLKYGRPE